MAPGENRRARRHAEVFRVEVRQPHALRARGHRGAASARRDCRHRRRLRRRRCCRGTSRRCWAARTAVACGPAALLRAAEAQSAATRSKHPASTRPREASVMAFPSGGASRFRRSCESSTARPRAHPVRVVSMTSVPGDSSDSTCVVSLVIACPSAGFTNRCVVAIASEAPRHDAFDTCSCGPRPMFTVCVTALPFSGYLNVNGGCMSRGWK